MSTHCSPGGRLHQHKSLLQLKFWIMCCNVLFCNCYTCSGHHCWFPPFSLSLNPNWPHVAGSGFFNEKNTQEHRVRLESRTTSLLCLAAYMLHASPGWLLQGHVMQWALLGVSAITNLLSLAIVESLASLRAQETRFEIGLAAFTRDSVSKTLWC